MHPRPTTEPSSRLGCISSSRRMFLCDDPSSLHYDSHIPCPPSAQAHLSFFDTTENIVVRRIVFVEDSSTPVTRISEQGVLGSSPHDVDALNPSPMLCSGYVWSDSIANAHQVREVPLLVDKCSKFHTTRLIVNKTGQPLSTFESGVELVIAICVVVLSPLNFSAHILLPCAD